jgi:hypothetical protein
VEACLCCDLYASVSCLTEQRNGLDSGEMDDVQREVWCEVPGRELLRWHRFRRLGDGRTRMLSRRLEGPEGESGGRDLYIVADGVRDRGNHLSVEHKGCGGVGEGCHGKGYVGGGDGWEFVNLIANINIIP